jgi:hypothetical protein
MTPSSRSLALWSAKPDPGEAEAFQAAATYTQLRKCGARQLKGSVLKLEHGKRNAAKRTTKNHDPLPTLSRGTVSCLVSHVPPNSWPHGIGIYPWTSNRHDGCGGHVRSLASCRRRRNRARQADRANLPGSGQAGQPVCVGHWQSPHPEALT